MKQDIAKKWVEALRSGKYVQGNGQLHVGNTYCCLGVLCELVGGVDIWRRFDGTLSYPPGSIRRKSGMASSIGEVNIDGNHSNLARLNDYGMGFNQIADIIEKHWEEL